MQYFALKCKGLPKVLQQMLTRSNTRATKKGAQRLCAASLVVLFLLALVEDVEDGLEIAVLFLLRLLGRLLLGGS